MAGVGAAAAASWEGRQYGMLGAKKQGLRQGWKHLQCSSVTSGTSLALLLGLGSAMVMLFWEFHSQLGS